MNMQKVDTSKVDLNLLKLFDALLKEGSVTAAGARIGLSQPAASRGLARLRRLFNDRILVRSANGWQLTPRALSLSAPIARLLDDASAIIAPSEFSPATATGRFTLACGDHLASLLVPDLAAELARQAPALDLIIASPAGDNVALIAQGGADLAIGVYDKLPARFYCKQLYEEDFVCIVRQGHALLTVPLTVQRFVHWSHIAISITGLGSSAVDNALKHHGFSRRVAVKAPYFLLASSLVVESDMILTLPRRLAQKLSTSLPITLCELPLSVAPFAPSIIWHERQHYDPAHVWLRQQIVGLASV